MNQQNIFFHVNLMSYLFDFVFDADIIIKNVLMKFLSAM